MENELFFDARHPPPSPTAFESTSAMSVWQHLASAPNCSPEKSTGYFLDPSTHFDSALCSVVPSLEASNSNVSGQGLRIRELIGTLGKNPNYRTPLSSNPKLNSPLMAAKSNVAEFSGDPAFAERARFSCFGSKSFNVRTGQFPSHGFTPLMADGKLSRVSSSPSLKAFGSTHPMESTFSEQISNDLNCRKRKANSKGKPKDLVKGNEINEHVNGKRCKVNEKNRYRNGGDRTDEEGGHGKSSANEEKTNKTKSNPKPPEPYKDYIHVRARRGQATDSHSLAERVRREKISERMKLLQDLVPGCNKVTGKALMLDEIINYVQSLQRQVEFLSMKLASVNTRLESTLDSPSSKKAFQSSNSLSNPEFPNESSPSTIYGHHNLGQQLPLINGIDQQFQGFEEDSLQSIVQMGIGQSQNRETHFQCPFEVSGMEIDLRSPFI